MKTCPWCEGKKVVGQLAYAEEPKTVTVLGVSIPIIGTMLDVPCKICKGTGRVVDNFDQDKRWAELRAAKTKGPRDDT